MRTVIRAVVVSLAVLAVLAGGTTNARAQSAAVPRQAYSELKLRIEQRFQVVVLRRGLVLVPKQAQSTYSNIEVSEDGGVLLDGTAVTGRELRGRVAGDADLVAQLSFLGADERRALFAPSGSHEAAPSETQAAPEPPAVTPPEPPEAPASEEGWVQRERYQRGGARVRLGGDVWVQEDEVVGDAVVAVFGSAKIDGRVEGDVVAVGGSVYLGPKADIRGDVVSVGGGVERQPGARVRGDLNEVRVGFPSMGPWFRARPWRDNWQWLGGPFGASSELLTTLIRMALVGLFAAMLVAVASGPVRRVSDVVVAEPFRAGIAGLAAQIFFLPVLIITIIVLAVSIIGIPLLLLVPFALLAILVALLLGFAGAGCGVGRLITRRAGSHPATLFATLIVGLAVIWSLTLIARFVGLAGAPVRVSLGVVILVGFVVEYAAWTVGLGAVLISRFGRRGTAQPVEPPPPATWEEPGGIQA
jgi:hypothetical protein